MRKIKKKKICKQKIKYYNLFKKLLSALFLFENFF